MWSTSPRVVLAGQMGLQELRGGGPHEPVSPRARTAEPSVRVKTRQVKAEARHSKEAGARSAYVQAAKKSLPAALTELVRASQLKPLL